MGKKSFVDGPALTSIVAAAMPCPWSGLDLVKDRLAKGQRLLEGNETKSPIGDVHPSLENIERNAGILRPLVERMKSMKRMSAWPIETYSVLCVAFYDGHKECYMGRKGNESFNPESWGFQQAWAMHKMISALRTKAMRDEIPRELSLELANRMFCFDVSLDAASAELVNLLRDAKRLRLQEIKDETERDYPMQSEGSEHDDGDGEREECDDDDDGDAVMVDSPDMDVFEAFGLVGDTVPGAPGDAPADHSEAGPPLRVEASEVGPLVRVEASAAGFADVETIADSPEPVVASSAGRVKPHLLEGLKPHMLQMLLESAERKMASTSSSAASSGRKPTEVASGLKDVDMLRSTLGRGKGDPKSPEPSGKHSSDEAEVPLAPVKEKPAVKDGNSKAKAKAKAKAKSKAKACPEAKSHPKSKAKAKAKAKSNGKRGLESPTEPTADEKPGNERAESVASPIRPRTLFTGSPAKPIFNTPARRDLGKGRGKGKKAANSKPVAPPRASDFLRDNQATLPNSFARRAIPAGVAALERYCRIVRAFQNQVECEIEPGTKCKTEVGISYLNKQR
ncbi:unnamed protein product [Symbiodinium sp. KB8]|nr:unnamed protein product [Symbiodinium sp. KB8]